MDKNIQSLHPIVQLVSAIASMLLFSTLVFYTIILSWRITCINNEIIIIPKGSSVSYAVNIIQSKGCMNYRDANIFKLAMSPHLKMVN